MNMKVQLSYKEHAKIGNHCQYFQSLEQKLLQQSDKLTNFMGKSLINDKSKTKLKMALSPSRQHNNRKNSKVTDNSFKGSHKIEIVNLEPPYLKKVKEICKKLRQPKTAHDLSIRQKQKQIYSKEREQMYCKLSHNLNTDRQQAATTKTTKTQSELQKQKMDTSEKAIKFHKNIPEYKSLTDTISTQSCKSIKFNTKHQNIRLKDFEVILYLAEGKYGKVFLVRHKVTNFYCALKMIPDLMACQDPKILTQRIRQIKIQSFLDHPNIIQLYSIFVENNDLYLLMELSYSGNLYHHLKLEGRFSEDKIRSIIKQVCQAVEYMHDNDILHRDLKPQNILFHENIVKICDFGWSVNSPLLRDTLCGTPVYSSPQIVQKQQYDNKVDIWNIGILTYQLLYGRVPFEIRTQEDLSKVIDDDIYFPRSKPASPEIKDFILRCLLKNPKERFSIAKLLDHQFLNPKIQNNKIF